MTYVYQETPDTALRVSKTVLLTLNGTANLSGVRGARITCRRDDVPAAGAGQRRASPQFATQTLKVGVEHAWCRRTQNCTTCFVDCKIPRKRYPRGHVKYSFRDAINTGPAPLRRLIRHATYSSSGRTGSPATPAFREDRHNAAPPFAQDRKHRHADHLDRQHRSWPRN